MRNEKVNDDAFAHDASATTARLRAGIRLAAGEHFSALVEGEGVAGAGRYNSGANGRAAFPAVTDPTGAEINQAWIGWKQGPLAATLGRQRLAVDNQRWIGNSGWRQNEQTFDAVDLQWSPAATWKLRWAWLERVHRVASDRAVAPLARERRLDTHVLHASTTRGRTRLAGYAYLHDDRDVPGASTATGGFRWTGDAPAGGGFSWAAEYARQRDYAANPGNFALDYWLLEPAWSVAGTTARAGWEHLGGNGRNAVQTPLATLHAFNGWNDRFTSTPADGLEDRYAAVSRKAGRGRLDGKLALQLAWHDYHADRGGRHYGSEWDASLGFPLPAKGTGLVKLARYRAGSFSRDETRVWLQAEWRGSRVLSP